MQLWLSHIPMWRVWDVCLLWGEICQTKEAQEKRGTPESEVFTAGCNFYENDLVCLTGGALNVPRT